MIDIQPGKNFLHIPDQTCITNDTPPPPPLRSRVTTKITFFKTHLVASLFSLWLLLLGLCFFANFAAISKKCLPFPFPLSGSQILHFHLPSIKQFGIDTTFIISMFECKVVLSWLAKLFTWCERPEVLYSSKNILLPEEVSLLIHLAFYSQFQRLVSIFVLVLLFLVNFQNLFNC